MKIGKISVEPVRLALLARLLVCFLGGVCSVLCALEDRSPLSAAVLAAVSPGHNAAAVLCGGILGAVLFLPFGAALRCCAILTLIAAVISAFRDTVWYRSAWFSPLVAAAATLSVEIAYLLQMGLTGRNILRTLSAAVLSAALCHYAAVLLRGEMVPRRKETREAERLRERLRMSAEALRSVYESISTPRRGSEENPAVIFDRAAEVVCRGCALREVCWNREYISTFNAFNDATPAILERGRAEKGDFALHFSSRCIHFPQLVSAINTEVSAHLLRRQYRRRLEAERQRTRGQYAQLSEMVVHALAAPVIEQKSAKERPYDVALGSEPKEGQRMCGDSVTYFKGGGRLHLLLSDGMGSGREAQRESKLALRLIEQFLTAGIEPGCALRTLNAALNLRGDESGSFTTVDLLSVDLAAGEAELVKYGAAPTYIKRGGTVRRLTGSALPAGLQESESSVPPISFPLEENSFVLMVSDGVADSADDKWLQDLLAGWQGEDPHVLVSLVLRECRERRSGDDDRSAIALYLPAKDRGRREV